LENVSGSPRQVLADPIPVIVALFLLRFAFVVPESPDTVLHSELVLTLRCQTTVFVIISPETRFEPMIVIAL
jgi:hypothetical protein